MGHKNRLSRSLLLENKLMSFIHLWTLMSRMVFPKNIARKHIVFLLLSSSTKIFLGWRSSMIIIRILLLPSRLLRILWLRGMHQIHLRVMRGVLSSLSNGCNS
jgi:hypothetical protein